MSMFKLSWNNATAPERIDLVFENRNKAYGAFVIRKEYEKVVLKAFVISIAAFVFAFYLPAIIRFISGAADELGKKKVEVKITELAPPPDMDETKPPPPPPPEIKLPDLKEVKFTPPVIVEEEVVEQIVDIKEMDNAVIGDENNLDGDTIAIEAPPQVNEVIEEDEAPVLFAPVMPEFPGGEEAFYAFVQKNLQYPPLAKSAEIEGRVFVEFVVNKDGSISDVQAVKGPQYGLREEAERVIKRLPAYKPGLQNGKPVKVKLTLPIQFELH